MKLQFSEEFRKYTNGLSEVIIEAETVGSCLQRMYNLFPQLYVYMLSGKAEVAQRTLLRLNSDYLSQFSDMNLPLSSEDTLQLVLGVPTGDGLISDIWHGATEFVGDAWHGITDAASDIAQGILLFWAGPIGVLKLFKGFSKFMQAFQDMNVPGRAALTDSSTYTWDGIQNTTTPGTPLPIVYGTFRIGGQYLNIYTTSSSAEEKDEKGNVIVKSHDTLYAQIGLCEGPIESVSDVYINNLPANYYNAVDFLDHTIGVIKDSNVRFGTRGQDVMPNFEVVSNSTTIGRKVVFPTQKGDGTPIDPQATLTAQGVLSQESVKNYVDQPIYGYRPNNDLTQPIVYGPYYMEMPEDVPFYYRTTTADARAIRLLWSLRDQALDGPATRPRQVESDTPYVTFVNKRIYTSSSSVLLDASGFTRITTSQKVNGFALQLALPALYKPGANGGYDTAEVTICIIYRVLGSTGNWLSISSNLKETISGKQREEISKTYTVKGLPYDFYEIAVLRDTPEHFGWDDTVDAVYIKQLTEYEDGRLAYPYTAMLGVIIRSTEQLSGSIPTITSLVQGMRIALPVGPDLEPITTANGTEVWTGAMSFDEETQVGRLFHSDNPVWCIYNLLTNKRYGVGEYFKLDPNKRGLMLANFYEMASYCNQMVTFKLDDGTISLRKRFTLNIVLDQSKSAAQWIETICAGMRAVYFYSEGLFWLEIDRPKYVSQLFNMSSISDYTQSGTSERSVPNSYEIQYINPENLYVFDTFRVESSDFKVDQSLEERKQTLILQGVTDVDHAKAIAKYLLVSGQHLSKVISFKTGTQGLRCKISDVIAVQHDVPQTGWGGKIVNVTARGDLPQTVNVVLSSPFDYSPEMGAIQILVQRDSGGPVTLSATAEHGDGVDTLTVSCVVGSGLDATLYTPTVGAAYILTLVTNSVAKFRVESIKRSTDETCEISAIQYDEQIYSLADDTTDLGVFAPVKYSLLQNPVKGSVHGLTASMKVYTDSAGAIKTGIEVQYQVPISSYWVGTYVYWSREGQFRWVGLPLDTSGEVVIPDVTVAGTYHIVATSVYVQGRQSISEALADDMYRPYAFVEVTPFVPNDSFLAGVSGLEVVGSLDGSYYGKECRLQWRTPVTVDQYLNSVATDSTTASTTRSWLAYYLVEIRDIAGTLRRSAKVNTESFQYSHEMNHEDGRPVRTYDVTVTAIDRLGRTSAPKTLRVTNPPPAALE